MMKPCAQALLLALLLPLSAAAQVLPPEMAFAPLPQAARPASAALLRLGERLFFDPILSATGRVACASCHVPALGWTDSRATAVGFAPLARNTPTIVNTAFNAGEVMFWDNRERSLEAQARHPLRAREEMRGDVCAEDEAIALTVQKLRADTRYPRLFGDAFAAAEPMTDAVNEERLFQAIATFERSLISVDTPFDRYLRGDRAALSASQQRGMKVFTDSGCQHCHGGPMLSDYKLHVIAVPGERLAFRTPSLRHLAHTAPYMHHGRLKTLDEVLLFYEQLMDEASETLDGGDQASQPPLDPLLARLSLRPEDFADLKAFLLSLSSADPAAGYRPR